MPRILSMVGTLLAMLVIVTPSHAVVGFSLKLGGAFVPDGSRPGAIAQADIGPISPFAEIYKKSGITTLNAGANLLLKSPTPVLSPYAGAGTGLSRSSGQDVSSTKGMANLLVGADVKLPGTVSFFGQAKYIYTFGTSAFRELAIQGGLRFYFGL